MRKISHDDLKNIVKQVYRSNRSMFLWGPTGIGKSQSLMAGAADIAEEQDMEFTTDRDAVDKFRFLDIRLSQMEPADVRGIPDISGERTVWKIPDWYPKEGKGILFFDELNLAAPSIQSAAYQIILDRLLDKYPLPEGWVCVAAGNRIEDRANVYEMSAPLRNRFLHYELATPHPERWIDWAVDNNIDARIVSFIKSKPNLLNTSEQNLDKKSFATPRSWEMLSDVIQYLDVDDFNDEEDYYHMLQCHSSAAVGTAPAADFLIFLRYMQDLDIDDILRDPKAHDLEDMRSDKLYALASAVYMRYEPKKDFVRKFIGVCNEIPQEFGVLMIRMVGSDKKNAYALLNYGKERQLQTFMDRYGKLFSGGI